MRARITVLGVVQGVGFRPFVAECARTLSLRGSVCNSGGVVKIEAYGTKEAVEEMVHRLRFCAPPAARVDRVIVEAAEEPDGAAEEQVSAAEGADGAGGPEKRREGQAGEPVPGEFRIVESEAQNGADLPLLPPDLPICADCLAELRDPDNRRFRYPFISCTSCGPRYSILEAVPYDREHISMRDYAMCPECGREYRQPGGRRRHAQTISCRDCGPQLILSTRAAFLEAWKETDGEGGEETVRSETGAERERKQADGKKKSPEGNGGTKGLQAEAALAEAVRILKEGGILALKGIGGYQFACRPDLEETVRRLRLLKGREKKPFAVMFSSLETIRRYCPVSEQEEALLLSPARPIVLLERKQEEGERFCPTLCSESRYLGAFLPYTGLHQLLTEEAGPLVMTSANTTDDPIFTGETELAELWEKAPQELCAAAWNTRRIVTPLDDSLMRVTAGHVQMLRRSRGFVPSPVFFRTAYDRGRAEKNGERKEKAVLAFGGDLKAVFCLAAQGRAYLSQYLGDMENYRVYQTFQKELARMEGLFGIRPQALVCDLHPGYGTTQMAQELAERENLPLLCVQHHHAHAASVMAEHGLERCIGVIFDGTGYGTDGHVWGGEFLVCEGASFYRAGHLEEIPLVGGDASSKDAALTAACHLAASAGKDGNRKAEAVVPEEVRSRVETVKKALAFGVNVQYSSSMGRLFDAVSALLGIRFFNSYEGECAIALENAAWEAGVRPGERSEEGPEEEAGLPESRKLSFPVREEDGMLIADRTAFFSALLREHERPERNGEKRRDPKERAERLALAFHEAAADMVLSMCRRIRKKTGISQAVFGGGVFANVLLQERCRALLEADGFSVYVNEQVPGNDGGICLGQAWIAERMKDTEKKAEESSGFGTG